MPYTGLTIAFTRLPGTDRLISISVHIMCYLLLSTVFKFTLRVPFVCTERIKFFDACLFSPSNVRSDFSVSNARTKDPLYFVVQLIPHDDTEYKFDPDQKTKWIYLIFFFFHVIANENHPRENCEIPIRRWGKLSIVVVELPLPQRTILVKHHYFESCLVVEAISLSGY